MVYCKYVLCIILSYISATLVASESNEPLVASQPLADARVGVTFFPQVHAASGELMGLEGQSIRLGLIRLMGSADSIDAATAAYKKRCVATMLVGRFQAHLLKALLHWQEGLSSEEVVFFFEGDEIPKGCVFVTRCVESISKRLAFWNLEQDLQTLSLEDFAAQYDLELYDGIHEALLSSFDVGWRQLIPFFSLPPSDPGVLCCSCLRERPQGYFSEDSILLLREENTVRAIKSFCETHPKVKHIALIYGSAHSFGYKQPGDMFGPQMAFARHEGMQQLATQYRKALVRSQLENCPQADTLDVSDPIDDLRRHREQVLASRQSPREPLYPHLAMSGEEALGIDVPCCWGSFWSWVL